MDSVFTLSCNWECPCTVGQLWPSLRQLNFSAFGENVDTCKVLDGPPDRVGSSRVLLLNSIQYTVKIVSISDVEHQVALIVTTTAPKSPQEGVTHILRLIPPTLKPAAAAAAATVDTAAASRPHVSKLVWISKISLADGTGATLPFPIDKIIASTVQFRSGIANDLLSYASKRSLRPASPLAAPLPSPKASSFLLPDESNLLANPYATVDGVMPIVPKNVFRMAFGIDIGGTLSKVVYYKPMRFRPRSSSDTDAHTRADTYIKGSTTYGSTGERDLELEFHIDCASLKGHFHFLRFETMDMDNTLDTVRNVGFIDKTSQISATGGGAHKYRKDLEKVVGAPVRRIDELEALCRGMSFLVKTFKPGECYFLKNFNFSTAKSLKLEEVPLIMHSPPYPYLIVNVGSGVSIIKVSSPRSFQRVAGSSLGGATFYGLTKHLTNCGNWKEALALAETGDNEEADLLVGDIYGGDYDQMKLKRTTVASSFGKLARSKSTTKPSPGSLARAALLMITNNLGHIADLHANANNAKHIMFTGNFLFNNQVAKRTLAYSIDYWSSGKRQALFLRHEGYFGAVGALISSFRELL